jgi:hypothetical protein
MKKLCVVTVILMLVVLLPLAITSLAGELTAKGRVELGGDMSFTYFSYKDGSVTDVSIMPRVGYFVIPKLEVEPMLMITSTSYNPDEGESFSGTVFGALLNVAYHFEGANSSKLVPFVFAGAGFASYSGDYYPKDSKTALVAPDAGAGIKYFITNSAVIRGQGFYEHVTNDGGIEDNTVDDFGVSVGVSIFVM